MCLNQSWKTLQVQIDMPRYVYRCEACRGEFEITHGMFHEQRECILCHRIETIVKVPNFSIKKPKNEQQSRPGKDVDEFIKDAKKDLKKQKKELKSEEM